MATLYIRKSVMVFISCMLCLCATGYNAYAVNEIQIEQPFTDTMLCKGGRFNLKFITTKKYQPNQNTFEVDLSDNTGSFATFVTIGFAPIDSSGTIDCLVPANATTGSHYRIRVRSTEANHKDTSLDNGKDMLISPYPTFTLTNNGPLCAGLSLTLSCTSSFAPLTYSWNGPGGFASGLASPTRTVIINDSGWYKLSATYMGCTAKDSTRVEIIEAPSSAQIRTNSPVCSGKDLILFSDYAGTGWTYKWIDPKGDTTRNANVIVSDAKPLHSGKYKVIINALGCIVRDSITVSVKPNPDTPKVSSNSPVCLEDTLKLTCTNPAPAVTYQWQGPAGFSAGTMSASIPNVTYAHAGIYTFKATLNGCSLPGYDTVEIGSPIGKPEISGTSLTCPGDSIKLYAKGAVPAGIFEWTVPSGAQATGALLALYNVKPSQSGIYMVVQKLKGCTSEPDSFSVTVPEMPKLEASSNSPICLGETLKLKATYIDSATYKWTGPSYSASEQNPSIPHMGMSGAGKYKLVATIGTCIRIAETEVVVKPLPSITEVSSNSPVCDGSNLKLNATSNNDTASYYWYSKKGFAAQEQSPEVKVGQDDAGWYYVRATANGCVSSYDSVEVAIKERAAEPEAFNNGPLKQGDTLRLSATCPTPGVTYSWIGPLDYKSDKQNDTLIDVVPMQGGSYIVNAHYNGCISSAVTIVTIDRADRNIYGLYPNPNDGNFTIKANFVSDEVIPYEIVNMQGRAVHKGEFKSTHLFLKEKVSVDAPAGVYILRMRIGSITKSISFTIVK